MSAMSRARGRPAAALALAGIVLLVLMTGASVAGLRVNTTGSLPVGLYRVVDAPVGIGTHVMFCPPRTASNDEALARGYLGAGLCPGGYGYLMKRVAAAAGDLVEIGPAGVRVNGHHWPCSTPMRQDRAGRPLRFHPGLPRVLGEDEILPMSDLSAASYDGRYFGPVARSSITAAIVPLITWRKPSSSACA